MTRYEEFGLEPDWWPEALDWHFHEEPVSGGRVKLALIENYEELLRHRHVHAALGDPGESHRLTATPGFKGHDSDSNGPHPSADVGGYEPRFWVFTDGTVEFEPLSLRWDSGVKEVVLPDQGFLMTYGLAPRYTQDQVVHWDDLQGPQYDLITADSSTSNLFMEEGQAFVEADASLLQDYASLRGLSVVQVFYVETASMPNAHIQEILGNERQVDIELPGRSVSLKRIRKGGSYLNVGVSD